MKVTREKAAAHRTAIVQAAADLFRARGLGGVGVAEIMQAAGLTHGGFYGHFESRAHLIAAALEQALADGEKASAAHTGERGSMTVKSIVNSYLSPAHRDHPSSGCAIPTLAAEAGRADPEVKAIMARQLAKSIEVMGEALGEGVQDTEQFAVSAWSMMVGSMIISRVMVDDPMADKVLALTRKSILELAALHGRKN